MSLSIKAGARLEPGLAMTAALFIAAEVLREHRHPAVLTSGIDGRHRAGSLHYVGLAIDFRASLAPTACEEIAQAIRERLGPDFDVIYEREPSHFHIEYQPKTQIGG